MTHPLIQRLTDEYGYPTIGVEEHDEFVAAPETGVLFFAGEPKKFGETVDVAVVLPELIAAFDGRLRPAVIATEAEKDLQLKYGFREWPSLVFVRDGGWLGTISRIRNWQEYLEEIGEILGTEPRRPPGFKIPVISA
ncbi:MAG: hydrogenase [Gemmatimonadota bacterium]